MRAGKLKQRGHMRVCKGIDDILPVPPGLDNAVIAQDTQLMRNAALRSPRSLYNMINAHFTLTERKQNFKSARLDRKSVV